MQQKNVSIEAFRFIFMVILCLWHIEGMIHIQNHGYLVVEFFFILSGYFLYRSFLVAPERSTIDFTIKKLKRFWIEYAIAMIPTFFLYQRDSITSLTWETSPNFIMRFFSELLFIHQLGIYPYAVNVATWYLSVLLFGGALIYASLRFNRQLTVSIILPIINVVFLAVCFNQGSQTRIDHMEVIHGLSMPLIRGIADMGIGIILCHILHSKPQLLTTHPIIINITSIVSLIFIILLLLCKNQNDAYMLLFCPFFLMGLFCPGSWLQKTFHSSIWAFLGGISYEMLLVHIAIRAPLIYFGIYEWMNPWLLVGLYLSLVLVSSYILKALGELIRLRLHWQSS